MFCLREHTGVSLSFNISIFYFTRSNTCARVLFVIILSHKFVFITTRVRKSLSQAKANTKHNTTSFYKTSRTVRTLKVIIMSYVLILILILRACVCLFVCMCSERERGDRDRRDTVDET